MMISGSSSGSAYIFNQNSFGNWTQEAKLLANDGSSGDQFGFSVGIYENVVIIGAPYEDNDMGTNAGAAYIFTKDETTGNWNETVKLLPNDTDAAGTYCGYSVAISGNSSIMGCYWSSS